MFARLWRGLALCFCFASCPGPSRRFPSTHRSRWSSVVATRTQIRCRSGSSWRHSPTRLPSVDSQQPTPAGHTRRGLALSAGARSARLLPGGRALGALGNTGRGRHQPVRNFHVSDRLLAGPANRSAGRRGQSDSCWSRRGTLNDLSSRHRRYLFRQSMRFSLGNNFNALSRITCRPMRRACDSRSSLRTTFSDKASARQRRVNAVMA